MIKFVISSLWIPVQIGDQLVGLETVSERKHTKKEFMLWRATCSLSRARQFFSRLEVFQRGKRNIFILLGTEVIGGGGGGTGVCLPFSLSSIFYSWLFYLLDFFKIFWRKSFKTTKNPKENPYQPTDLKISRKKSCEPKVSRLAKFVISKKKTHTLPYGMD